MFLNEPSSDGEESVIDDQGNCEQSEEKVKVSESIRQSQINEDCNYHSIGAINDKSIQEEDSYQDYLNNADLDPSDDLAQNKSIDKRKIIKTTSNNKVKKQLVQPSK